MDIDTIETRRDAAGDPIIWKYIPKKKIKKEFVEIRVISDEKKTKERYIIDKNKRIFFNVKKVGDPTISPKESDLSFQGLLILKKEGHVYKDNKKKRSKK